LEGHPKCGRLHGHNYKITVGTGGLLVEGMVIDYAQLDRIVKPIVEEMDHRYLVSMDNVNAADPYYLINAQRRENGEPDDMFLMDIQQSTAELIAGWLYEQVQMAFIQAGYLGLLMKLEVIVCETPKVMARFNKF
jgi:6-pyruvoyltetrahydropterin/6-carboxytetrahydropterin synthase